MTHAYRVRGRWIWISGLVFLLALAVPLAPTFAEGEGETKVEEEEPELEGEEKKRHEREVKALVKYLKKEKNQQIVIGKIEELGAQKTRVARDALMLYASSNKNHEFVSYAFRALAKIGGKKVIEFLCGKKALQARDFLIQHAAAESLGQAGDDRATGPLLDAFTSQRTKIKVVSACAIALAKCSADDERALEVLFEYSRHRKDTIRAYTVEALGYLATDEAVDRLQEALFKDKNTRVREYAALGFGHTKRADTIPLLREALEKETAFTVRQACMNSIRRLQGKSG